MAAYSYVELYTSYCTMNEHVLAITEQSDIHRIYER